MRRVKGVHALHGGGAVGAHMLRDGGHLGIGGGWGIGLPVRRFFCLVCHEREVVHPLIELKLVTGSAGRNVRSSQIRNGRTHLLQACDVLLRCQARGRRVRLRA